MLSRRERQHSMLSSEDSCVNQYIILHVYSVDNSVDNPHNMLSSVDSCCIACYFQLISCVNQHIMLSPVDSSVDDPHNMLSLVDFCWPIQHRMLSSVDSSVHDPYNMLSLVDFCWPIQHKMLSSVDNCWQPTQYAIFSRKLLLTHTV